MIGIDSNLRAESSVDLIMSPGQTNWPFVINVGNSIIGVTVLAMPFCFKTCGIVLGSLLLFFSTWLTLKSCKLLMKAGVTSRRRSYSLLAYYTHGATGKLIVEVGMIGLQLGTLVAQVVIIGDLGPAIVSKFTGLPNTDRLRTGLIVCLCLFVGLPLGLLKDVRTLSKTSAMCIMFYAFFTVYVVLLSIPKLATGNWYTKVNFWRKEGFFQCLPIFSFAFGCQTQLFIVYEALSEPSLKRINSIVSAAVHMCTAAYLLVGFFGYIAFCDIEDLSGDIINHFSENSLSDAIKLFFVFSIAVSIPLIVFPCRASLYTLLFPQKPKDDMPGNWKIPEVHFKVITIFIIIGSMIIGILVPNVEFVLGLNGATMGTLICYICPALFFLAVMSDTSEGKASGRMVLVFGFTILILSTYTTLATMKPAEPQTTAPVGLEKGLGKLDVKDGPISDPGKKDLPVGDTKQGEGVKKPPDKNESQEERQEPPNPQPPQDKPDVDTVDKKKVSEVKDVKDGNVKEDNGKLDQEKGGEKDQKLNEEQEKLKIEMEKKVKQEAEEKWKEKDRKQDEILEKLEQQKEEQQKIIEEQKHILEELKQHQDQHKDDDTVKVQQPAVQADEGQPDGQQPLAGQQHNVKAVIGQQGGIQGGQQQLVVQQAHDIHKEGQPLPVGMQGNQQQGGQLPQAGIQGNQQQGGQPPQAGMQGNQQQGGQLPQAGIQGNQQQGGQPPQAGMQGNQQQGGQPPQAGMQGNQVMFDQQKMLNNQAGNQQGQQGGIGQPVGQAQLPMGQQPLQVGLENKQGIAGGQVDQQLEGQQQIQVNQANGGGNLVGGIGQPGNMLPGGQQPLQMGQNGILQGQQQQQQLFNNPGLGYQQKEADLKVNEMAQGHVANQIDGNQVFNQVLGNLNMEGNQGNLQNNIKPIVRDDEKNGEDVKKRMKRDVEEKEIEKNVQQNENVVNNEVKVENNDMDKEKRVENVADGGVVKANDNQPNGGNRDLKQFDDVGVQHDNSAKENLKFLPAEQDAKHQNEQDIEKYINELTNKLHGELHRKNNAFDIEKTFERKR